MTERLLFQSPNKMDFIFDRWPYLNLLVLSITICADSVLNVYAPVRETELQSALYNA